MAELKPEIMLPSLGETIKGKEKVQENLWVLTEALEYIFNNTIEGLNAGLRKDQIFQSIELPEHLKNHPLLKEQYVTAKDISKMIIKQYTGWWDDIPSHWTPASIEAQAIQIVALSGGIENLIIYTRELANRDLALAAHFTDWAYFAEPQNSEVQQLVLDIYKRRIMSEKSVTQEMLVYLDHMSIVREQMK